MQRLLPSSAIVGILLLGCGPQGQVTAQDAHLTHPEITIRKPHDHDEVPPRREMHIQGEVTAKENEWSPIMITIKITDYKQHNISHGSFGLTPKTHEGPGSYPFEARLKAPPKPGKYLIWVWVHGPPSHEAESKSKTAGEGALPKHEAHIEIQVKE